MQLIKLPITLLAGMLCIHCLWAADLRIGIIGCDTSHVPAFAETFNNAQAKDHVPGGKVVAAFKGGSPDLPHSATRVDGYAGTLAEKYGVTFYDSIDELCSKVDVILLESVDGRVHLEQARPVIKAGKPLFIDKPMAASLQDVIEIYRLAEEAHVPVWSSSSLRYAKDSQAVRDGLIGEVLYAETYSPCEVEEHHPELFWYGIHGVEALFTVMGPGCESVRRGVAADGVIEVTGIWRGGRKGIYREDRSKKYHGLAKGEKGEAPVGSFDGHFALAGQIMKFFQTGLAPVQAGETIEIFAFMTGAAESKRLGGALVKMSDVMPVPPHAGKTTPQSFAFETYAGRAYNYLENMVDKEGMPYFHILWTDPAQAVHAKGIDAPDVVSRMWEASIMARHMTGRGCRTEKAFASNTLRFLTPETGLVVPGTGFFSFTEGISVHALTTAYADGKNPAVLDLMRKTVKHLPGTFNLKDQWRAVPIKSLMNCARLTHSQPVVEYVGKLVHDSPLFMHDNRKFGGHMHAGLRTLAGAADYALYTQDTALFQQVDALYRDVRTIAGARFGWLPETVNRSDDLVGCETCAVMDFVGLAATLANNGHPAYFGDVERVVRNHLAESQVVDGTWLKPGDQPDTATTSWREVGSRMAGGFAGWSSPTHLLAYKEGGMGKTQTRAFQNCCGGSGVHAFYIAWKSAARFVNGVLSVNMHLDKLLPQAEIRCHQPYRGYLSVALKETCQVRVRVPDFVAARDIQVRSNGIGVVPGIANGYLELGSHQAGEKIEVTYPVPVKDEEIAIGNPKHRQYHYRVMWKGDTVVRMTPVGEQYQTGFSEGMKKEVEVFYGEEGPGRLYQRESMLTDITPRPAALHSDDGAPDFWSPHAGGESDSR